MHMCLQGVHMTIPLYVAPGQKCMSRLNTLHKLRHTVHNDSSLQVINPLRMRSKGYGTWFVCVCVFVCLLPP